MTWYGEERDRQKCYKANDAFVHGPHNYFGMRDIGNGNMYIEWYYCVGCDYVPRHRKDT